MPPPKVPTDQEWEAMEKLGTIVVHIPDSEDTVVFKKGNQVLIVPENIDPLQAQKLPDYKFWVAKISEIRSKPDNVWVKVQWYWAGTEIAGNPPYFKSKNCAKYERILSDAFDYVSIDSFLGLTKVHKFRESLMEHDDIGTEEFFCRWNYRHVDQMIEPEPIGTCICKRPYNPDRRGGDIMHFCPRPSCRQWHHRTCLSKDYVDKSDCADSRFRLLVSSPDSDDPFMLPVQLATTRPRQKEEKKGSTKSATTVQSITNQLGQVLLETAVPEPLIPALTLLSTFPENLIKVAQQPIVRGGQSKAVDSGGIVGNVRSVVQARRLVHAALLSGGEATLNGWEEKVKVDIEDVVAKGFKKGVPALLCPRCKGPI